MSLSFDWNSHYLKSCLLSSMNSIMFWWNLLILKLMLHVTVPHFNMNRFMLSVRFYAKKITIENSKSYYIIYESISFLYRFFYTIQKTWIYSHVLKIKPYLRMILSLRQHEVIFNSLCSCFSWNISNESFIKSGKSLFLYAVWRNSINCMHF